MGGLSRIQEGEMPNRTLKSAEAKKEEVLFFLQTLAAAPDSFKKNLSGEEFAEEVIAGTKKLFDHLQTDQPAQG
jgi:hypothetical protein